MPDDRFRLSDARPDDAPALAALKLAAFRETFLDGFKIPYPPADLAVFEEASYGLATVRGELADTAHHSWVAADAAGAFVAYAHVGPCKLPHGEVAPGDPELYQLYLRNAVQGAGLGTRLLDAALDWLGQGGRPIWLGVWSGNARAQKVYAGRGFTVVGEYRFKVGTWFDEELIMRRDPPRV